jgi:hypothetical protein
MVVIYASAHSQQVLVIRCDIKLESVKKCRDVENEPISEKSKGYTLRPRFFLKHRHIFLSVKIILETQFIYNAN